tara:strand:+ start:359 stop:763 length:405 start_codon:yes stop_codon:yes gene_type:complete
MKKRAAGKWIYKATRHAIYMRDNYTCAYCGTKDLSCKTLSLDHLICWSHGGSNKPNNLVTCCLTCNSRRGANKLSEWYKILDSKWNASEAEIKAAKKAVRKARRTSPSTISRLRKKFQQKESEYLLAPNHSLNN